MINKKATPIGRKKTYDNTRAKFKKNKNSAKWKSIASKLKFYADVFDRN